MLLDFPVHELRYALDAFAAAVGVHVRLQAIYFFFYDPAIEHIGGERMVW